LNYTARFCASSWLITKIQLCTRYITDSYLAPSVVCTGDSNFTMKMVVSKIISAFKESSFTNNEIVPHETSVTRSQNSCVYRSNNTISPL